MGRTPDRYPEEREEEGLILQEAGVDPVVVGGIRVSSGAFRMKDGTGVFDPRQGGSGMDEPTHNALDFLGHMLDENHYGEITKAAGKVTNVDIWTDSGKGTKVRDVVINRSGSVITSIVAKQYDGGGALKETLTTTPVYSSGAIVNWTTVRATP